MKIYRVEIPAIKIIDVEAQSERSALEKIRKCKLDWETTDRKKHSSFGWIDTDETSDGDVTENYHYETSDFKKATIIEWLDL